MPFDSDPHAAFVTEQFDAPILSFEEERELALRYRDQGDESAFKRLVVAHGRLAVKEARNHSGYGLSFNDLVSEGLTGLAEGVVRFDPDHEVDGKPVRVSTYVTWWIRARIQAYVLENFRLVRFRRTTEEKRLFGKLGRTMRELGIDPATFGSEDAEMVAERLGVKAEHVASFQMRMHHGEQSIDVQIGEGESGLTFGDTLADDVDVEGETLDRLDHDTAVADVRAVIDELPERSRDIVLSRHLADRSKTLAEMAEKYGISRERVRQIEAAAIDKVRKRCAGRASGTHAAVEGYGNAA